jgi:hypothetical protein
MKKNVRSKIAGISYVANEARSFYQHDESVHSDLRNNARIVNILAGFEKMPPQLAFRPRLGIMTGGHTRAALPLV